MAFSSSKMITKRLFIMLLLLSSLFTYPSMAAAQAEGCPFSSIYHFGSSESSNGDSFLIDHLASAFNLPSPTPYTEKDAARFDYGASFATRDATIMRDGFFVINSIHLPSATTTLDAQFDAFATFLGTVCSTTDQECMEKIQRALYFLDQVGINDYKYAFLQGKSIKEVTQYVPYVTESIVNTIRKMIEVGATSILVPGSLPIGCLPGYQTLFHSDDPTHFDANMCHRGLNTFAKFHNDQLRQDIFKLQEEHPHVNLVYADYYNSFMSLLSYHDLFGFQKQSLMNACCGIGGHYNFDQARMCGDQGVPVCSDPTKYIHWDGFGLTQEANKLIVEPIINGKNFLYPCRRVKTMLD